MKTPAAAGKPSHLNLQQRIQPHGMLLVLDETDWRIVQTSANTRELSGIAPEKFLGSTLDSLITPDSLRELHKRPAVSDISTLNPVTLAFELDGTRSVLEGSLYQTDGGLLVMELEPPPGGHSSSKWFYNPIRNLLAGMQNSRSLEELFSRAAAVVRDITGFEQVVICRFDGDWNSRVVAEEKDEEAPSLSDTLHPARFSPQARELALCNWLRLTCDTEAEPVPLIPEAPPNGNGPVNLAHSVLVAGRPECLDELRTMNARAFMSCSLIRDDGLWGLILGYNYREPLFPSYNARQACEFLCQTLSLLINEIASRQSSMERVFQDRQREKLLTRMGERDDFWDALLNGTPNMADLIRADGAAVIFQGEVHTTGVTPSAPHIRDLGRWLRTTMRGSLFSSNNIESKYPEAAAFSDTASAVVAAVIDREQGNFLLWFRGGADAPERDAHLTAGDGTGPAEPRKRAAAWTPVDLTTAERLRMNVIDASIRRTSRELLRLNEQLVAKNQELDSFAYIASHDLKEPLRGLNFHARVLLRDYQDKLDDKGREKLGRIQSLTMRMSRLLDSLLKYSRAGNQELELETVDLSEILEQVRNMLATSIERSEAELRLPADLPSIHCDPVKIGEVFQNLIGNALKYNDSEDKWVEIGLLDPQAGRRRTFYVRDNGIGIAPDNFENIFNAFRRLHTQEEYGGGTGMGLPIVRRIIERHQGRIWLESTPGEGTTFFFTLGTDGEHG